MESVVVFGVCTPSLLKSAGGRLRVSVLLVAKLSLSCFLTNQWRSDSLELLKLCCSRPLEGLTISLLSMNVNELFRAQNTQNLSICSFFFVAMNPTKNFNKNKSQRVTKIPNYFSHSAAPLNSRASSLALLPHRTHKH